LNPANQVVQGGYSLVNASVGWADPSGHFDVRVWSKNLNGKKYISYASSSIFGDQYYPAEPRTYGVTARYHF